MSKPTKSLEAFAKSLYEMDVEVVAAQARCKRMMAAGKTYSDIAASLFGTRLDGMNIEGLLVADTVQKRLAWVIDNFRQDKF